MSTTATKIRYAALLALLAMVLWGAGCSSDEDNGTGPVSAPPTTYFWEMRVPTNFADFQAVGVASMDTVVLSITNDRFFDDTDAIQTTLVSYDRGEAWQYGDNLKDTVYHGLRKFDQNYYAISNESIFKSGDGENWTPATWAGTGDSTRCNCVLQDLARGSNGFVAAARRYLGYSANGDNWVLVSRPQITSDNVFFNSVTFDGSRYVVLATNFTKNRAEFYVSTDGISWSLLSNIGVPSLNDLLWADSGFVAVGEQGLLYTSKDAVNWASTNVGTLADLTFVEWGNRQYIVGGTFGTLMISNDGTNWVPQSLNQQRTLLAAYWTGIRYVAVGENLIVVTEIPKN